MVFTVQLISYKQLDGVCINYLAHKLLTVHIEKLQQDGQYQ